MLKKRIIATVLFLTYALVFAHAIVPHDHDLTSRTGTHFNDSCAENDTDENENDLSHTFEHYLHAGISADTYLRGSHYTSNFDFLSSALAILTPYFDFDIAVEIPVQDKKSIADDNIPVTLHCLSPKGLRAPPIA